MLGCGLDTASVGDSPGVGARPVSEAWSLCCQRMSEKLAVSGGPHVSVVQAADLRNRDHLSFGGMFDSTRHRRIPIQRQMRARLVIILKIRREDPNQVSFTEYDHVVQAFSANRANQSLNVRALPRRSIRDGNFLDAHMLNAELEVAAIDTVTVSDHESRRIVIRKRIGDLLSCPTSCWMGRDVEVDDHAAIMPKDNEAVQQLETHGPYDEEVDGCDVADVILQECPPSL